jgi:hypothetical protein
LKKIIKEELPISESYPYSYNPNRSKFYYTNITLDDNLDIEKLKTSIEEMLTKFPKKNNKTVVVFDNLSTMPNEYNNLLQGLTSIYESLSEKVTLSIAHRV